MICHRRCAKDSSRRVREQVVRAEQRANASLTRQRRSRTTRCGNMRRSVASGLSAVWRLRSALGRFAVDTAALRRGGTRGGIEDAVKVRAFRVKRLHSTNGSAALHQSRVASSWRALSNSIAGRAVAGSEYDDYEANGSLARPSGCRYRFSAKLTTRSNHTSGGSRNGPIKRYLIAAAGMVGPHPKWIVSRHD